LIIPRTNDVDTKPIELWARYNKLKFLDFEEISKLSNLRLLVLQSNKINETLKSQTPLNSLEILGSELKIEIFDQKS